jgi:hypothetical protein
MRLKREADQDRPKKEPIVTGNKIQQVAGASTVLYRQEALGSPLPAFVLLQHSKPLEAEECDISGRLFQITGKQRP